jgi:hypothetical protein
MRAVTRQSGSWQAANLVASIPNVGPTRAAPFGHIIQAALMGDSR